LDLCKNTLAHLKINQYSTGLFCQLLTEKTNYTKICPIVLMSLAQMLLAQMLLAQMLLAQMLLAQMLLALMAEAQNLSGHLKVDSVLKQKKFSLSLSVLVKKFV
jgi:hypothetical protein